MSEIFRTPDAFGSGRKVIRALLWALAFAAWPIFAGSRDFRISGRVTDSSGAVVPHASITAYSRSTAESYGATTDEQGSYSINVPQGKYLVQAAAPGLHRAKPPVDLEVNGPEDLPLQL